MLYSEDIFSLSINSPIPLSLPQAIYFLSLKSITFFLRKVKKKRNVAN
ncbi:hypothetical protein [Fusobacterium animalis]